MAEADFISQEAGENTDLFDDIAALPSGVQSLIARYESLWEDQDPYLCCREMLAEMQALGYTFEYGLDGEPFGLMQMDMESVTVPRHLVESLAAAKAASDLAQAAYTRQQRGEFISEEEKTSCMLNGIGYLQKPATAAANALDRALDDMTEVLMQLALHDDQTRTLYYDSQSVSDSHYCATPSLHLELLAQDVTTIPLDLSSRLVAAKQDAIAAYDEFKRLESKVEVTEDNAIGWRLSGRKKLMAPATAAHNVYLQQGYELANALIAQNVRASSSDK